MAKIPKKFLQFIKDNSSTNYQFKYDKTKTLKEQNLKPETKGLIALIYRDYLCDETEKQEYLNRFSKFCDNIEMEKREKYNPNEIFKNRNTYVEEKQIKNNTIVTYKETIFSKIFKFFKKYFIRTD